MNYVCLELSVTMHTSSSKPFFTIQTYEDRNNAINRELNQKVSERLSAPPTSLQSQRDEAMYDKPPTNFTAAPKVPPATPIRTSTTANGLKAKEDNGDIRSGMTTTTVTNATGVNVPPPPPFPIGNTPTPRPPSAPSPPKVTPPPPPHQTANGFHNANGTIRAKTKAPPPPVPIKTSVLSHLQPPPCPTPDYDTLSLSSNNATLNRNGNVPPASSQQLQQKPTGNNDSVEMESLDSFKLNKPYDATPRPPSTYFNKYRQNGVVPNGNIAGNGVVVRKSRPVSVTIGEYPSGTTRKAPGKLEFLQRGDETDGKKNGNTQFANELAMTLSRSNLRKRTESMADSHK